MAVQPQPSIRPLTVSELNIRIHDLLAARFQSVSVKGEVSGVAPARGGHIWFTLKDASAQVGAVVFASTARRLPFYPENGQELIVTGQVDYHTQSGRLNLVVNRLDYDGAGKLRQAIEQLKRRLDSEGAFRPDRKRPLPFLPQRIALITSPSGAVIHDLQQTIWERFPNVHLLVYPAAVQGTASMRSLAAALRQCNRDGLAEVCIVARGGGSFEELMAFNQEGVVRAIQAMRMPVVTALGHTSDRTLSDLVADREARTPTAAAELVVPSKRDLERQLGERSDRLTRAGRARLLVPEHELAVRRRDLQRTSQELITRRRDRVRSTLQVLRQRDPREVFRMRARQLADAAARFQRAIDALRRRNAREYDRLQAGLAQLSGAVERTLQVDERGLLERSRRLESLGPSATLRRGYSICLEGLTGAVIRQASSQQTGSSIRVVLSEGELACRVEELGP